MLNNQIYIGSTDTLDKRFQEHNNGMSISTKRYKPWILYYYEAYRIEKLARLRERNLKYHGNAIRELKKRIGLLKSGAGYTLIELLVVITIIGVLMTIAFLSLTGAQKKARDAKRKSDLKIIQSALEDYHADQLYYPTSPLGTSLTFGTKTYLNTVPTDPKPPPYDNYSYIASDCTGSQCKSYCLYANMEGTAPNSDSGCTPSGNYDYGVTRP